MTETKKYEYRELFKIPSLLEVKQNWKISAEGFRSGLFGEIKYHQGPTVDHRRRWEVDVPMHKERNPGTPEHHYQFACLRNALSFVKECAGLFTMYLFFEAEPLPEPEPVIKNTLILTIGLPRSGKSTWARETGCPIVNLDSIRLALHGQRYWGPAEPMISAHAHLMVSSLFLAGNQAVIMDSCNHTARRRTGWYCREDTPAQWMTVCHLIDTEEETCHERAIAESDMDIRPVITRMAQQWDYRPEDEDWSEPTDELMTDRPNEVPRGGFNIPSSQELYKRQIEYHK